MKIPFISETILIAFHHLYFIVNTHHFFSCNVAIVLFSILPQTCWMCNFVYNCSLLIHNCSPHIYFGSENRRGKDDQVNIRCNVVRLCTLMSYDYRSSCRTFIATHVVRHDNLIKTPLDTVVCRYSNIPKIRNYHPIHD